MTTRHQYKDSPEATAIPESKTGREELVIDDGWLEAILENLALANLSRAECVALIKSLEDFERNDPEGLWRQQPSSFRGAARSRKVSYRTLLSHAVVGEHFDAEFNQYAMRSPESMTADNVRETIEHAARYFGSNGYSAAVRQIVFFISGNIDEVIADDEQFDME